MRTKPLPEPIPKALHPLPKSTSPILRTGSSAVVYHIPTTSTTDTSDDNNNLKTTILLPRYSTWSSGLHFHATHTEYIRLVRGAIYVRLGSRTMVLTCEEGEEEKVVTVPKYVRHDWGRAEWYLRQRRGVGGRRHDASPEVLGEDVVVEEWTDPRDLMKPLFFWNLNGVILNDGGGESAGLAVRMVRWMLGNWWVPFQLFVIFRELDNFPIFFEVLHLGEEDGVIPECVEHAIEYMVTYSVLFVAHVLAGHIGIRAVSEDRTPKDLWAEWRNREIAGP
ncbi:hypothetical protein BU24DRAFT_13174 [Aaosphaeria arxii CBS 175.79]|uniref:Uncharacterized protein n=1 Tax=Aaosphaeria arxii CBS 175.79 TaxID=1450172 RepID=A0A6A5Y6W1_9PLEO|nr:uncharacterized protein BU24DRAFT_13174 [Aaosphaeria arxii CBS 175.79]KAF2021016.1 hypothetical protein BU24DRAFT_13174 [Aaosphaeria arxii CBS 175.79]